MTDNTKTCPTCGSDDRKVKKYVIKTIRDAQGETVWYVDCSDPWHGTCPACGSDEKSLRLCSEWRDTDPSWDHKPHKPDYKLGCKECPDPWHEVAPPAGVREAEQLMRAAQIRPTKSQWVASLAVGEPDRIFGYPYDWNADLDTIGAGKYPILFGDFSKYVTQPPDHAPERSEPVLQYSCPVCGKFTATLEEYWTWQAAATEQAERAGKEALEKVRNDPANTLFGIALPEVQKRLLEWTELRQRVAELEAQLTKIRTQFCEVHQPEDDEGKTCSRCEAVRQADRVGELERELKECREKY